MIDNQTILMKNLLCFLLLFASSYSSAQLSESNAKSILLQEGLVKGIHPSDLSQVIITDNYTSRGITHVYFKQEIGGIEIQESSLAIHGGSNRFNLVDGRIIQGLRNLNIFPSTPLSVEDAIRRICYQKSYAAPENIIVKSVDTEAVNKKTVLEISNISESDIPAKLVYYQVDKASIKLGWQIEIEDVSSDDYFNFIVDAETGNIIREFNYTVYCAAGHLHNLKKEKKHREIKNSENLNATYKTDRGAMVMTDSSYNVFEWPIEAPHNGDRTIVVNPYKDNLAASPNGWHTIGSNNYTTTRGNNVDAYIDDNNSNGPTGGDAARADGGADLEFDFALDTSMAPAGYKDAAVTNLFYWNNIIHDFWYNYGFDEASGNFQEENFSGSGNASDYVRAEAQDGGGSCNANMGTPSDGGNPRMQMYNCGIRDGDFDNGVIVHEYGHGISNRLTGGPGTSSCLNNTEQMGEGWSDYFGMVMTIEPGDLGSDSRGMGTWLFEQGPDGPGIRPFPYSTDFNINPFTYDDIKSGVSVPHGLGSVWATMLWDMTWALIDEYGWDPDIYNGTGGNNIAMELVIEGLKQQPCSPGFVDGRDGILAADDLLNGGVNKCLIWNVFARRGLGFSADQGSSGSRSDGTEAFDVPETCNIIFEKTADIVMANPGDNVVYAIKAVNSTLLDYTDVAITDELPEHTFFVDASDGGTYDGGTGIVSWPIFTLPAGDSVTYTLEVQVDPNASGAVVDFTDDMESGNNDWNTSNTGSSFWSITDTDASSGTFSWFAEDVAPTSIANLILASPVGVTANSTLSFSHYYDTEESWDGGLVAVSIDAGQSWIDQEDNFITNGYNNLINNSQPGFSGDSGGFITSEVDLSDYAGQNILVRFRMNCDQFVTGVGWWIDDVTIDELALVIPNTANIMAGTFDIDAVLMTPTVVEVDPTILYVNTSATDLTCFESMDGVASVTANSGSGNYTYLWDGGATTSSIDNLAAGTYGVTINDGITTITTSVVVDQPQVLALNMSFTNAHGGPSGSAAVEVQGGTPAYNYLWNTGATTSSINGLIPGTYIVSVTDDNLCMDVDSVMVIDPSDCGENVLVVNIQLDDHPEETTVTIRDASNNILVQQNYAGEAANALVSEFICATNECYTIEIGDSGGDGLCAGNGYYEVLDGVSNTIWHTGCDIESGTTVDACYPFMTTEFVKTNPTCTGDNDGSITVNAMDGTGNYTYDYGTGDTGSTASNLAPGIYVVTVSDGVTTIVESVEINNSITTVFTDADSGNGSLRYAITNGCLNDTITFDMTLMGDTLKLQSAIDVPGIKVINGLGINNSIISGNNITEIFTINTVESRLSLLNLSLIDAEAPTNGGAIYNKGQLHLESILFKNNRENGVPLSWSGPGGVSIRGLVEIQK